MVYRAGRAYSEGIFMSRITTPFSFHSTLSEIIEGINLTGKRAIVGGHQTGRSDPSPQLFGGLLRSHTARQHAPRRPRSAPAELASAPCRSAFRDVRFREVDSTRNLIVRQKLPAVRNQFVHGEAGRHQFSPPCIRYTENCYLADGGMIEGYRLLLAGIDVFTAGDDSCASSGPG